MSKIYLRFSHDTKNEIQDNKYLFDTSITIREMLNDFLKQTNSIITLDPVKITFMFGPKLLNTDKVLDMKVGKVFNSQNNKLIKIIDNEKIVGGIVFYNFIHY